jgi:hypothetical protein
MKIAYRRQAGMIALSPLDTGTRGLWFEKRLALVAWLRDRGHVVHLIGRKTKASTQPTEHRFDGSYDMLMIEFGSSNKQFYGDDIAETLRMAREHRGPVVFLNDDPDLPFPWKDHADFRNWTVWMNGTMPAKMNAAQPDCPIRDFPFAAVALVKRIDKVDDYHRKFVYLGRPKGREKVFQRLLVDEGLELTIAGRAGDWADFKRHVVDAPDQPKRSAWYRQFLGSLAVADAKHKRLGFRTGRAFHALLAGVPFVAEADHPALAPYASFRTADDIRGYAHRWSDPDARYQALNQQIMRFIGERQICEATAERSGL